MVTVSDDQSSVSTSDDYNRLKEQYGQVSGPNEPSQSSASQSSYPSCPSANDTFVASTTLPPTPNLEACSCLEDTLGCQFHPSISNYSTVVGELIGTACSLLGEAGGNCDEIGGNGQSGTYGRISGCDPSECEILLIIQPQANVCVAVKLSYAMSLYYEINNRNPQSCDFAGNATVNNNAPASQSAANSAASSCIASPSATFTPSSPAGPDSSPSDGSGDSGDDDGDNGAFFAEPKAFYGLAVALAVMMLSSALTLA